MLNQRFQRAYNPLIPNNLQKYFHIQPNVENDSLKVNKYEKLRNPFYFQKSANDSKIYLPNYDFTQYNPFSPQNTLPKINQDWTVGYNTDYNLLEKNLKNIGTISLDQSQFVRGKQGGYYVDNNVQKDPIGFHNEQNILDYLNAQEGYTEIISNLTLKGEIIPGQVIPNKPKGSPIEVYYYGKDQGFPIYVYIS